MLDSGVLDRLFGDRVAVDGTSASANFARWFANSRALDQAGAPLPLFHGTRGGNFTEFKPRFRPGENLGFGIHFAEDRSFAERYALDTAVARRQGGTAHVFEVFVSVQNPLVANTIVFEGSKEFELAKKLAGSKLYVSSDENRRPCAYMQNAVDSTSPHRALKILQDSGYDGVFYETRLTLMDPGCQSGTVTAKSAACIVFLPNQIKSLAQNSGLFRSSDPCLDDGASVLLRASAAHQSIPWFSVQARP